MNSKNILILLFAGFLAFSPSAYAKKKKEAKAPPEPKKVIAVMPIQKVFQAPLYMSTRPGLLTHVMQMVKEKDFKLSKGLNYDPQFVSKTLSELICQKVLEKGYLIYTPDQMQPELTRLQVFENEFPIEKLKESFDANAFLMITITDWDAEKYDTTGIVRAGFEALLVDAKTKQVVWTNRAVKMKLKPPSDDFLYSKYQRDILQDLANRILKGFPKKAWEEPKEK